MLRLVWSLCLLASTRSSVRASDAELRSLHALVNTLSDRVAHLEAKHQEELQDLKTQLVADFRKIEKGLRDEITDLRERLRERQGVPSNALKVDTPQDGGEPIKSAGIRNRRYIGNDAEVAFFATITPHDVEHLGTHQNIVFDKAITNAGSAYHRTSGTFIAPVDGIYVISATVCGRHVGGDNIAHIQINGVPHVNFIIHPYEQSSHTIIEELRTGDNVSVINLRPDDAIIGANFSSFSGFLLYQIDTSPSAIVG